MILSPNEDPTSSDKVSLTKNYCGASYRGAIGDCIRKPGHKGNHCGAHGYEFTQEGDYVGNKNNLPHLLDEADARRATEETCVVQFLNGKGDWQDYSRTTVDLAAEFISENMFSRNFYRGVDWITYKVVVNGSGEVV